MSRRLRDIVKPWGLSARVPDVQVRHLMLDSRQVSQGDLFVALRGHARDGRDFIEAAICQGACAILVDSEQVLLNEHWSVPVIEVTQLAQCLGGVAARFYGIQPQQPVVAGVTGTNGKTSVSHYLAQLLSELETPAGIIGTLGYGKPEQITALANTTPDVLTVHRLLAELSAQHDQWVAMEVSSHGLVQNRVAAVPFQHAIFTNLSRDHLDYHQTMEAYGQAKAELFLWPELPVATINHDDAFGRQLLQSTTAKQVVAYGLERGAELKAYSHWLTLEQIEATANGFQAQLVSSWGHAAVTIPLLGRFNLSNLLAAIGPLLTAGFELEAIAAAVSQLKPVAGRMEAFTHEQLAHTIVDYAHTPDALASALQAARFHCKGKLWCLFGCGGDRDVGKRPLMAKAAEHYADQVVVTSDNPRSEQQADIATEVRQGFENAAAVVEIEDRHQAIQYALQHAAAEDLILIAGKGHEDYQEVAGTRLPFSDRDVVAQLQEVIA